MAAQIPVDVRLQFRCQFEGCDPALLFLVDLDEPVDQDQLDGWLLKWCLQTADELVEVVWIQSREPQIEHPTDRPFFIPAYHRIDVRIVNNLTCLEETLEYMWTQEGALRLPIADHLEEKENREADIETLVDSKLEQKEENSLGSSFLNVFGNMTDGDFESTTHELEELDDEPVEEAEWQLGGLVVNLLDFPSVGPFDASNVLTSAHNLLRYMAVAKPPSDRPRVLILLPYDQRILQVLARHEKYDEEGSCEFVTF